MYFILRVPKFKACDFRWEQLHWFSFKPLKYICNCPCQISGHGVWSTCQVYRYNPTEICQQRLQGVRNVAQKLCSWERSLSERVYSHDMIQVVTFDHNLKFHIILKKSRWMLLSAKMISCCETILIIIFPM